MTVPNQDKSLATRKVTLVGALVNTLLAVAQLVGGFFTASQALIADGFHTLSDLASDFVVLFAAHHAHKEADADHPYGHGRFETVATVVLGLMLAGVAISLLINVWHRLGEENLISPSPFAMMFAALAIICKEGLFHYTMRTAKQVQSKLLEANAWHHRTDVISSVVVFLGVLGSQLGWPLLDSLAAVVVAIMILFMAGNIILDSTRELVDTGLEPDEADEMQELMGSLPGVQSVHMLRTRLVAGKVFADAHIQVDSHISVSEGHHIAENVMRRLKAEFQNVDDVTVHIDPEDDEVAKPSADLPLREDVIAQLKKDSVNAAVLNQSQKMQFHYVDGALEMDIFLNEEVEAADMQHFYDACLELGYVRKLCFYQGIAPN